MTIPCPDCGGLGTRYELHDRGGMIYSFPGHCARCRATGNISIGLLDYLLVWLSLRLHRVKVRYLRPGVAPPPPEVRYP